MDKRIWLGLLLSILATISPVRTATAQNPLSRIPPTKQSHHDLPGGFNQEDAEQMMAQRLQELQELHQLQDQVQGLLEDRDFLDQIKTRFTEEELQKVREKLLKGKGLGDDSKWKELLQQVKSRQKLDEQQIEKLRNWAERNEIRDSLPGPSGTDPSHNPDAAPSGAETLNPSQTPLQPPPQPVAEPEPSLLDRMQQNTTSWMIDNLDSVGGDIIEALAERNVIEENSALGELLRSVNQPDFSSLHIGEQAMGFSRYLSEAGDFLHEQHGTLDDMRSFFAKAQVPSLPNLGVASASIPAAPAASGGSWMPTFLSLLLFGAVGLLLYLRGLNSKSLRSGEADEWRLGAWPVPPGRVSTRQEVIRAFEYLALLCLGTAARVCHHRELAERLSEQDSGNPARRHAAEMLAWVYEQARYAPPSETLSPEQLSDARQALCLLAGVTAP